MRKTALMGAWATCVCLAIAPITAQAAPGDVVLYATDAVRTSGAWTRTADATAAAGTKLASTDSGWSQTTSALASPTHFIEFSFDAPPNTAYHVWVRLRALSNNKNNDSVYAQFSDAVTTGGTPVYGIGTTNSLTLNLAAGNNGKMNGWGWVDGAYWLSQQSTIAFTSSGAHTLRIQTREDGIWVDQVVLSPATYLTASPGQRSGDSTIIAKPPTASSPSPLPFSGAAIALPGTIEAEDFDHGGEGVSYHDADTSDAGSSGYRDSGVDIGDASEGSSLVGWTAPGEWLLYSVNVAGAGQYVLEARVASPVQGGTLHVEFNNVNVTGAIEVPASGGWQSWTTVSKVVTLGAGPQFAKVVFDTATASGLANLNWVRVSPVPPGQMLPGPSIALPGTIALDQFDNGVSGVAYFDTSAGNSGGVGPATDVDLELGGLGATNIGWIADGEWVTYSVNVATAGPYTVTAKVASPNVTGRIRATLGSVTLAQLAVPNTGAWQVYQDITWTADLPAGPQKLTLFFDAGGFNLGSFAVATPTGPLPIPEPLPAPCNPMPCPIPDPQPGDPQPAPAPTGRQIVVNQGGDLQAAINSAVGGDVILLQAGATFAGNFVLPAKSGDSYITIRTNITDPVAPGTRITPATAVNLAKIKSPNTYTALATAPYSHHYVLQLLDFPANVSGYGEVISLGDGSNAQNSLAMVPHHLYVDRVYVHGDAAGQKRGIGLNSASTIIRDSGHLEHLDDRTGLPGDCRLEWSRTLRHPQQLHGGGVRELPPRRLGSGDHEPDPVRHHVHA